MATMAMTRAMAPEQARASVWLLPSQKRSGASAPVAASTMAAIVVHRSTEMRPRRSARAEMNSAKKAPMRTAMRTDDTSSLETPKSALKYVLVWLRSTPR